MSQNSTKQYLEESLSALVDGEITEMELHRLLKADDEQFAELRESWSTYQVASTAMKKESPTVPYQDISAQISAAIAEEPVHSVKSKPVKTIWAGVGRFAIAASVAGAVVLGVQFAPSEVGQQVADTKPAAEQAKPAHRIPSSFENGLPQDTTVSTVSNENRSTDSQKREIIITEGTQKKLEEAGSEVNRLMLEHAQNAVQNTQQGVLPYARVPESDAQ